MFSCNVVGTENPHQTSLGFFNLFPGPRVYSFTTPEASRVYHHSPESLLPVTRVCYEKADDKLSRDRRMNMRLNANTTYCGPIDKSFCYNIFAAIVQLIGYRILIIVAVIHLTV